jgi:ribosome-binding factor A
MRGSPEHRRDRVAEAVKQHIAEALLTKVKDPRIALASVSRVEVSPDLSHATVMITVLGSDEEKKETLAGLHSARGYLRTLLAGRLQLRAAPELHFIYDRGIEGASRIHKLLDDLKEEGTSD